MDGSTGKLSRIDQFRGDYYFLSNFFPVLIEYGGLCYENAEAAFQAQKCLSDAEKQAFCNLSPTQAKHRGRRVALRPDWEEVKVHLMAEIVRAKFTQHPELSVQLLGTGDARLLEGNTWHDTFWGVDLRNGKGQNELGKVVMALREELRTSS